MRWLRVDLEEGRERPAAVCSLGALTTPCPTVKRSEPSLGLSLFSVCTGNIFRASAVSSHLGIPPQSGASLLSGQGLRSPSPGLFQSCTLQSLLWGSVRVPSLQEHPQDVWRAFRAFITHPPVSPPPSGSHSVTWKRKY